MGLSAQKRVPVSHIEAVNIEDLESRMRIASLRAWLVLVAQRAPVVRANYVLEARKEGN